MSFYDFFFMPFIAFGLTFTTGYIMLRLFGLIRKTLWWY